MPKTRVNLPDPTKATGKSKTTFDGVKQKMGTVPNMFRAMSTSPAILDAYMHFSIALASGKLDPRLREKIAVFVAQKNGCDYCMSIHTYLGNAAGINQEEIFKNREGQSDDRKTNAALQFARAVLEKKGEVTDQDWQAIKQAGFNDEEILEIIGLVVLNIFTNYFNRAVQTEIDFPLVTTTSARR